MTLQEAQELVRQYRDAWRENIDRFDAEASHRDNWDGSDSYAAGFDAVMDFILSIPAGGARIMRSESQETIEQWATATFGPPSSNMRIAARANEEMAELIRALSADDNHPKAAEEVADVVIVLCRLATYLGVNLWTEIDRKMEINRQREWKLTGDGHGYHTRAKAALTSGQRE